ncbi:MAG: elongation factor G, partial [Thermoplasmata archaeon]|nr:elongation factor G [Thermoplasmata archaeon]
TKLDKDNTDFGSLLATITEVFGDGCVPVGFPVGKEGGLSGVVNIITGEGMDGAPADVKKTAESWREKLIDAAAATDDSLIEKYLESGELSAEELASGLKKSVLERKLIPVLAGSSKKGVGIEGLLDTVSELMPSPAERGEVSGIDGKEARKPTVDDPFSALIFKSVTDPFVGQLTYFRVYSGRLTPDSEVLNTNKGQRERIAHIYELQGKEQKEVKELLPGMIGAVTKLKSAAVGDTLSDMTKKITYDSIEFPKPVVSMAVSPKAKGDEEKISNGLSRLAEEDPTLKVVRNAETKQLLIEGLGDLHLEVIVQRLKNKFNVEIDLDIPKVAYQETVTALGEGHEKHKKQSGGRGQYGEVYLKVEPMDRGAGFEFVDQIVGGVIPRNFIPA